MRPFKLADLLAISSSAVSDDHSWLGSAEDSINFLRQNASNDEIVIYASTRSVLIHGVLGLSHKLTQEKISKLQDCNIPMPNDSWSIQRVWGGGKGHRMYLEPPLASVSDVLYGGEKLIFRRSFVGVSHGSTPIELSQKLIHSLELYFVPERRAYCRLDCRGDIEDVVRVIHQDGESDWDSLDAVVIRGLENTDIPIIMFSYRNVSIGGHAYENVNTETKKYISGSGRADYSPDRCDSMARKTASHGRCCADHIGWKAPCSRK